MVSEEESLDLRNSNNETTSIIALEQEAVEEPWKEVMSLKDMDQEQKG